MQRRRAGYYLIYLRKSRADAEKEKYGAFETLAVHEKALTELAERERLPIAEDGIYRELVSGESLEERNEFRRIMDRISDPMCIGVIVHAIDRLGRGDPMEYGFILSNFRYSDTLIVTPGRTYNPRNADDIQQLKLQMFVSNIELEHIKERMHNGNIASAERGNYQGSKPPYGYDKVPYKSAITPNDHEAPVVRLIFELAANGINKGAIARHLNNSGIKTRHGHLWAAARVGTILSNPVYKGKVRYGYRKNEVISRDGMKFVKKSTTSNEGSYVLSDGVHEPLVTEEEWNLARINAFEGVPVQRDRTIKNPLAGLIVCAKCGRAMVRQEVKNKYGARYDRLHHAYGTACQCKSISTDYVVSQLCEALEETARNLEAGIMENRSDPAEIGALRRALSEEDRKLDKMMELYYAEAITVGEFKTRRAESSDRAKKLRARIDDLESRSKGPQEIAATTREALSIINDDSVSAEDKNTALRGFIEKVEYEEIDQARKNRNIKLTVHLRGLD